MFRNFHEDLKSIWLFVDIAEGFIVVFEGFVLLDLSSEWGCVDGHDGDVLLVYGTWFW